jgi:hypothetical protein
MNIPTPNIDKGLLDSKEMNSLINGISNKIKKVYKSYQTEIQELETIERQNLSFIMNTKNRINKIKNDLNNYILKVQQLNNETNILTDSFNNNLFIETSDSPFEEILQKNSLSINKMEYDNQLKRLNHTKDSVINIIYNLKINRKNYNPTTIYGSINNIKENNSKSYWHEKVYFEENFLQSSFQKSNGIETELIIKPKKISKLNNLRLQTFAEYPIEILEISYIDIKTGFKNFIKIKENFIDNYFNLDFKEIQTNELTIKIKQIHFEKENNKYIYNLGLYFLQFNYINYTPNSYFLSMPIMLDATKQIDYYMLDAKDSDDINYSIIEYCKDPEEENKYKIIIKNILQSNLDTITNEILTISNENNNYIGKTKYPFKDITIMENGETLNKDVKYFANEDYIIFYNYNETNKYSANYIIQDNIIRKTSGTSLKPIFIRVMAKSKINEQPSFINHYTVKIKYKGDV